MADQRVDLQNMGDN